MTCIVKVVLFNAMVVYILIDFCTACEQRSNFCDIESWSNWSACNATCGTGVQKREKFMCCQPKSLTTCLSTCNISSSWWQKNAVEDKTCGVCKNGGVFDATRNRCKCPIGFVGSCCNDFSVCGFHPCQHGGKCTTNGQGYNCTCTPGYAGSNCRIDIDECASNPCQNGGSCRDKVNKYSCSCITGYTGINCQTDTVKTTVKSRTTTIPTMTATSEVTNTEKPTTATTTISVTQTLPPLPPTIEISTISVTRTILTLPTNTTQTIDYLQRTASSAMSLHTATATTQAINASKSEITMPSTITIQNRTLSKATTVQSGTPTDATIQSSILLVTTITQNSKTPSTSVSSSRTNHTASKPTSIVPVTTITQNSKTPSTSVSSSRTNHTASKPTSIVPSPSIISSTIKPNTKKGPTNITHSATGSFTQIAQNTTINGNRNRSVHQNIKTITPLSIFVLTNITTQRTSTATNTKEITPTTLQEHLASTTTHVSTINSKTTPSISVSTINSNTTSSKYVSTESTKTTTSIYVSPTSTKTTQSIYVSPTSTKTTLSISLSTINSSSTLSTYVSTSNVKTIPSKYVSTTNKKTTPLKYVSAINWKMTPSKSVSTINLKMTPSKFVSTINLNLTPSTVMTTASQLPTTSPLISALISNTPRQTAQTAIISTGTNTKTTNKLSTRKGSTISKTTKSTKPIWKTKPSKKLLTIQSTTKRNTFTSMVIVSPVIATFATTLPKKSKTVSMKQVSTSTSLPLRETGMSRLSNKATLINVRTLSVSTTHKRIKIPATQMSTSPTPFNSLPITTLNTPTFKRTTKTHKRTTTPVIVMKSIPTTLKARSRMTSTISASTATQTPISKSTKNRKTNIASRKRTVKSKRPRLHTTTVKTMPRTHKSESNYGSSFAIAITSVGALILFLMCGFAIWNIIKVFSIASELAKITPFKEKTNDRSLISDW